MSEQELSDSESGVTTFDRDGKDEIIEGTIIKIDESTNTIIERIT